VSGASARVSGASGNARGRIPNRAAQRLGLMPCFLKLRPAAQPTPRSPGRLARSTSCARSGCASSPDCLSPLCRSGRPRGAQPRWGSQGRRSAGPSGAGAAEAETAVLAAAEQSNAVEAPTPTACRRKRRSRRQRRAKTCVATARTEYRYCLGRRPNARQHAADGAVVEPSLGRVPPISSRRP
jgi:hypothetical protein